ncbi:hypothetical protein P879_04388 [Paragonimus westermani]|uniref:Uncharacterized protein n=1 Tax=Paragonimus westermani TaxID=34504 RepID=A0A8T0DM77_9TREM|nr:hypothetical protein P879_04388 [Paragonimus westermani]
MNAEEKVTGDLCVETVQTAERDVVDLSFTFDNNYRIASIEFDTFLNKFYRNIGADVLTDLRPKFRDLAEYLWAMNCSATSLSQIQKSAADWISQVRAVMRELQTLERACQQYRTHQSKADEFCTDIYKFSGSPQFDLKRIRNDIGSLDLIKKRHKNLKEKLSTINEHLKDCEQDEEPIPSISELDVMRTEIARLRECKRHLEEQVANYCGCENCSSTARYRLKQYAFVGPPTRGSYRFGRLELNPVSQRIGPFSNRNLLDPIFIYFSSTLLEPLHFRSEVKS